MDKKQMKKKRMIVIIIVAVVICIIGYIALESDLLSLKPSEGAKESETMDGYVFNGVSWQRPNLCEPDWETDIFTLERYLELNRYLTYTKYGVSETVMDIDSYNDDTVHMMYEYFDALMHGDAQKVNSFYTEDYFKENPRYEKITMQKIYDMEMEYITEWDENIDGIPCTVYVYKVGYKILENDGTFRADIQYDNAKIPLFFTLIDAGSSVKISAVSNKYNP